MPREAVGSPRGAAVSQYYSPATKAGGFVFASGQGPWDPALRKFSGRTIEEQADLTLRNLKAVLEQAGATLEDVVKVQVHLRDIEDFDRFNAVYAKYFVAPRPARTTVGSDIGEIMIEIDAVAYVGERPSS